MRRRGGMWVAACLVAVAGCGSGIAGPAVCAALVNVSGVTFTPAPGLTAPDDAVSADPLLTVSHYTGCQDVNPSGDQTLAHGESNFLEIGTPLHTVDGFTSGERLAVYNAELDAWQVLVPLDTAGSGG